MSAPTPLMSTSTSAPTPSMITSPSVPELDEVRAWIEKMIKALRFVDLVVAVLALIGRMRDINLDLVKQLVQFRRARPRSETLRRLEAQHAFAFMGEGARPLKPKKPKQSRKGRHPGRAALPAHLPRVEVINAVPLDQRKCPVCGSEMTTVGYEVGERLEAHPARLYVLACKSERVACPHDDTIVTAKVPPQIVERGKLGDTLILDAVADKFLEHQPTERQSRRFSREGVDLPPQTLGRSMAAGVDLFSVIARDIQRETLASALLGTDASALPVLDQDHPLGIRNGTMWCWVGGQRWVTFFYARHGDAQSVRNFLGDNVCRTVQCDGTSILNFIERAGGRRPGCWAHGRRRFVACARAGDELALVPLRILRRVFAVERLSALLGETPEQRLLRRTEHSAPAIAELRAWLDEHRGVIPPKSALGQALGYL